MLEKIAIDVQRLITSMQVGALFSIKIVGAVWIIHIVNAILRHGLNFLGIRPRSFKGLSGIFFSPFLHGNFNHLFFNTIPLFVLSDLILLEGKIAFYYISGTIILLSGALLWLFGQRGTHIGASGVIMGYFGYLLSKAYFHITATTIILAGLSLYYFGGMLLCLFPGAQKNVSWDGHVFGFLSGIFTAYYLQKIMLFIGVF